ncbi:MAG: (d)CMP kinase [Clostridia bacterium]|nr:(d)CMP kinase [Clostridia bacterium]
MKKTLKIAIDGPSGAGKSSLAKGVAKKLGLIYVDTGALYRAVGLFAIRRGVAAEDKDGIIALLPSLKVEMTNEGGVQRVYLCGEDVSDKIRTPEVSHYASSVSAVPEVRKFLFSLQREIADKCDVIMDGRDIGTVILPDADLKVFLTASAEARAKRRYLELTEKGIKTSVEELIAQQNERDARDSGRDVAPLTPADDAVLLDNSGIDLEKTIDEVIRFAKEKGLI